MIIRIFLFSVFLLENKEDNFIFILFSSLNLFFSFNFLGYKMLWFLISKQFLRRRLFSNCSWTGPEWGVAQFPVVIVPLVATS